MMDDLTRAYQAALWAMGYKWILVWDDAEGSVYVSGYELDSFYVDNINRNMEQAGFGDREIILKAIQGMAKLLNGINAERSAK